MLVNMAKRRVYRIFAFNFDLIKNRDDKGV